MGLYFGWLERYNKNNTITASIATTSPIKWLTSASLKLKGPERTRAYFVFSGDALLLFDSEADKLFGSVLLFAGVISTERNIR